MRIVAISGVWRSGIPMWLNFEKVLAELLPRVPFHIEEDTNRDLNVARLRWFADSLVEKYNDGKETLIFGYSMGGLVSCKVASELHLTPVFGIVSIFAPHQFMFGLWSSLLEVPHNPGVPVVSFGATHDVLVPYGARHPSAISHTVLSSTHRQSLVYEPALVRRIVEIAIRDLHLKPERL